MNELTKVKACDAKCVVDGSSWCFVSLLDGSQAKTHLSRPQFTADWSNSLAVTKLDGTAKKVVVLEYQSLKFQLNI
jgi:hypothetical protein